MNPEKYYQLEKIFATLPSEKDRLYEKTLANIAENSANAFDMEILNLFIENKSNYSYEAFVCLLIIHRRNKNFYLMKQLFDSHPEFKKKLSYNHMMIQYLVHSESFYDYDDLLISAYKDAQLFDSNAGYLQAFCNAFVTICECCDAESCNRIVKEWYDEAIHSIDRAIELDPDYAKFYCTKGRIVSLNGKFNEAIYLINEAISKENSNRPDYALTIMNYQMSKMSVQLKHCKFELESRLHQIEEKINSDHEAFLCDNPPFEQKHQNSVIPNVLAENEQYAFISYAHADKNAVYDIIQKLQQKNTKVWFDKGLELGKEWPEELANRILKSSVVVVMLTTNSILSSNVRREVTLALSENKPTIVVRLDSVNLTTGMKLQFGMYQMILKDDYDNHSFIETLSTSIKKY